MIEARAGSNSTLVSRTRSFVGPKKDRRAAAIR